MKFKIGYKFFRCKFKEASEDIMLRVGRKPKTFEGNEIEDPAIENRKPDTDTDSENELNEYENGIEEFDSQPSTSGKLQRRRQMQRRNRMIKRTSNNRQQEYNSVPDDNSTSTESTDQTIRPARQSFIDTDRERMKKVAATGVSVRNSCGRVNAELLQRGMPPLGGRSYSSDDASITIATKPKPREQPLRQVLAEPINEISDSDATYCLCERPSDGQMVRCDNDICPWEWFHFKCVSLRAKPQGKWYCPRCRDEFAHRVKVREVLQQQLQIYDNEMEKRNYRGQE